MPNLKDPIVFQPVYDSTVFDNGVDCQWYIFFEELNLRSVYKPLGYSSELQPTFKVFYSENENDYELFYTQKSACDPEKEVFDLLNQFCLKALESITLLDGPPKKGMYVRVSHRDLVGNTFDPNRWPQSFNFIRDLSAEPEKRQGYSIWSDKSRMWWDDASNFFEDGGVGGDAAVDIARAVFSAEDTYDSALDLFMAEISPRRNEV